MLFFATSKFTANNLSGPRGLRCIGVVAGSILGGAMEMCLPCYALCFPMYMEVVQWSRAPLVGSYRCLTICII
jgi:hypothetical protein